MVRLGYDHLDFVLSLTAAQRRMFEAECGLTTADAIKMERHLVAEQVARRGSSVSTAQLLVEALKGCVDRCAGRI